MGVTVPSNVIWEDFFARGGGGGGGCHCKTKFATMKFAKNNRGHASLYLEIL